jgi:hypothetical protein
MSANKYGAVRTEVSGVSFDSKLEARRFGDLCILEMAGDIIDLERQPRYELLPAKEDCYGNRHRAVYYTGDFRYTIVAGGPDYGRTIVEDCKGYVQADAKLRMAMLMHQHPELDVRIVRWDRRQGWVISGVVPKGEVGR